LRLVGLLTRRILTTMSISDLFNLDIENLKEVSNDFFDESEG